MTGKQNLAQPVDTDLPKALATLINEAMTSLQESFHDLTDEQAWSRPFADKPSIGTIVMHLSETLDTYACKFQSGQTALEHQARFNLWNQPEGHWPEDEEDLPTVEQLLKRHAVLWSAIGIAIRAATTEDLLGKRHCDNWWTERKRTASDALMRAVGHAMAHVRQIWLIRGAMGLTSSKAWPRQHLA